MHKITALALLLFLTLALAGCGETGNTAKPGKAKTADPPAANTETIKENSDPLAAQAKGEPAAAENLASSSPENPASGSPENPALAQATGNSSSAQAAESTGIVAKSGNIISSSDKEALLNDVDKELDALLSDVNSLEDVQDSDLNLNQ